MPSMSEARLIRLAPSAALKERRLEALLGERGGQQGLVAEQVQDAQLLGSLELAGFSLSWEEIKASRQGDGPTQDAARCLRRAQATAEAAQGLLSVDDLMTWHTEVTGKASLLRTGPRERVGGPPASQAGPVARHPLRREYRKATYARKR